MTSVTEFYLEMQDRRSIGLRQFQLRCHAVAFAAIFVLTSCGLIKKSTENQSLKPDVPNASVIDVHPRKARPGQIVTLVGKNFSEAADLLAQITMSGGLSKDVAISVEDAGNA
jgi:hypothetical protein